MTMLAQRGPLVADRLFGAPVDIPGQQESAPIAGVQCADPPPTRKRRAVATASGSQRPRDQKRTKKDVQSCTRGRYVAPVDNQAPHTGSIIPPFILRRHRPHHIEAPRPDPILRIMRDNVQYVCVDGRQLAVVDMALALVIQAATGKPGLRETLLAHSRSLQDSALMSHGDRACPDSVVLLSAFVPAPPSAPPPFGLVSARLRAVLRDRQPLAYTALGLAWLFDVLKSSKGDRRLAAALRTIVNNGIVDAIAQRLDLVPMGESIVLHRPAALANVAIVCLGDPDDQTDLEFHARDDFVAGDAPAADPFGCSRKRASIVVAAMRNELHGADPWTVVGRGERHRALGTDAREACALLTATATHLSQRGRPARLLVDSALGPRVDDKHFSYHAQIAFGLVAS